MISPSRPISRVDRRRLTVVALRSQASPERSQRLTGASSGSRRATRTSGSRPARARTADHPAASGPGARVAASRHVFERSVRRSGTAGTRSRTLPARRPRRTSARPTRVHEGRRESQASPLSGPAWGWAWPWASPRRARRRRPTEPAAELERRRHPASAAPRARSARLQRGAGRGGRGAAARGRCPGARRSRRGLRHERPPAVRRAAALAPRGRARGRPAPARG